MRRILLSIAAAAALLPAIADAQVDSSDVPVEAPSTETPADSDPFATESAAGQIATPSVPGVEPTFMVWGGFNASEDYFAGLEVGARWRFIGISVAAVELNRDETPAYLNEPLPAANIARTVSYRRPSIGASLHAFYDVTPSFSVAVSGGVAQRKYTVLDVNTDAAAPVGYNRSASGKESETLGTWGLGFWWGGNSTIVVGAGYNSELGISADVGYRW